MVGVVRSNDLGERSLAASCSEMAQLVATGGTCNACNARYGHVPSGPRSVVFTRCMTGSGGVTSCWKRGRRVRKNRGAAGVDRQTLAAVEAYGVERMLGELQRTLRQGRYRPAPVRRVAIPKSDGGVRPLGIPTVCDRVVQQATRLVLEPIFEADFLSVSHGFRPRRSALEALERIWVARRGVGRRGRHPGLFRLDRPAQAAGVRR